MSDFEITRHFCPFFRDWCKGDMCAFWLWSTNNCTFKELTLELRRICEIIKERDE